MSELLLDTHIWLWFVAGSPRLPPGLRRQIERSRGSCVLSSVSVWEAALLVARGRLEIGESFRQWVEDATSAVPVREAPLTNEVAIRSHELEMPTSDPADRFLAATALVHGLTLLTVDRRLSSLRWLRTRSR